MAFYAERIRSETIDELDNFILQTICPNSDEMKGCFEHNK
jgi:hypothetical protein